MNFTPPWPEQELSPDSLFGCLIRTAVDGIMVIDEQGLIQVYNAACVRLFQYAEAEVLGQNVKMLMPPPYRDQHDDYLTHYKQTGEARIIGIGREVSGQRKDGSSFPMYLSVGDGILYGKRVFVGIVHDLSALYQEREAYEAHLLNLREELVHVARVSELGQVSAGIAHELNQPLTAMLNYANAARRLAASGSDEDIEKVQSVIGKVAQQAERAGQIVRRMRDFLEKRASQRGCNDIVDIIDDAMALGLLGAKASNIQTHFEPEDGLPAVLVDRVQIQQVLVNLLRNAVEAMERSEQRHLTLSAKRQSEDRVEVTVADTGHGIAETITSQLFKPFVTTKDHGMGIGLAISKTIVEAHGGVLTAEPNPGGGTIFRFTVPADATASP
ncbi:MAG: ATP-binding protein [Rhizomicrobium sp.]|nr:ATP-binding protein [Rhizomicrobium sp.]